MAGQVTHEYVRVYNNGEQNVYPNLTPKQTEEMLRFDSDYRPGVAVFVDGLCKQAGYLSMDRLVSIGRELLDAIAERG